MNVTLDSRPASALGGPSANTYATLQSVQLNQFTSALPDYVAAFRWPCGQLRAARRERLRRILAVAKSSSPWHAKRLRGIDIENFEEDDIRSLPVMTKADLMANFDDIVTDRSITLSLAERHLAHLRGDAYFQHANHAITSGGSSGMRGVFVFDWDGWVELGLSSARPIALMLAHSPEEARRRAVVFVGDAAAHSSVAFAQSFGPWIVSQFGAFIPLSMGLPLDAMVAKLNELQPTSLSGYPSLLYQLCFAAEAGQLRITPVSILVGAEPLLPEQRAAFKRTWGAKVFNFYGCSEAACVGFSCPAGEGLHLCDDTAILEPVDRHGAPAVPGTQSASILVTNLFNALLPLIRYELDDSVVPIESRGICACGSSFQVVAEIEGRTDDVFAYEEGTRIHPFLFRSVLGREQSIIEYQVRQTASGADISVKTIGPCDLRCIAERIARALRVQGLADAKVSVAPVEKIERGPVGKLRRFVPLS